MIRTRFFGSGELIQRYFRRARYSAPRTYQGKERLPVMTITCALIQMIDILVQVQRTIAALANGALDELTVRLAARMRAFQEVERKSKQVWRWP